MKRNILLLTLIIAISACSDKKRESELENRITELETQLDDCKKGADQMLAKIKIAFDEKKFSDVKSLYYEIQNRHPESAEFTEAKAIYDRVIIDEEEKRKEAERIAEKEKAEKLKALNKLKKSYDDVSGITWYKQPYFTHYTNTNLTSI
jgi:chromosome segregation ATPase